ncbi:MAG: hypothetical protein K8M05_26945 [Deltaproteobacteria bacterium]|nr:hypothetical protein [Kofleriaceae bacterium]
MNRASLLPLLVLAAGCGDEPATFPDAGPAPDTGTPMTVELPPAPADWLVLFDRSVSWETRADRFQGLKDGVAAFLAGRSAEVELAITSFPRGYDAFASCDVRDFSTVEHAWPASDATITEALAGWDPTHIGSTLGPALEGAGVIARERRAARPGRSTSIVLLTDASPGEDETCETSEWSAVAAIAADVFAAGHGPNVHVIGVLGTAIPVDHPVKVGGIAGAGGGYAAFVNGSQLDVATSSHQALRDLEARAAICTRALPAGFAPETLTVTSPDGTVTQLGRVADASACVGAAFYLDDPDAPTTATLCSGERGVGGVCEQTFVRALLAGAPTVTAR